MSGVNFEWGGGLDSFMNKLRTRQDKLKVVVPKVLFQEAEEIMSLAKPLTPVDHGFLRASGHVQLPVIEGEKVSVELGFGGVAGAGNQGSETNESPVGYAVYVHENLAAHH